MFKPKINISAKAALPYLLLLSVGVGAYQFAWRPINTREAQLIAEKARLQTELAAQEHILGQRAAVQEMNVKWEQQRLELARRVPPLSYWPEMLARIEGLFFRPGLTVSNFRIAAPAPLLAAPADGPGGQNEAPPAAPQDTAAVPAPQQGDMLAAQGEVSLSVYNDEDFFNLLAGLEALDFLVPVRAVSYTAEEAGDNQDVQVNMEFMLLLSAE